MKETCMEYQLLIKPKINKLAPIEEKAADMVFVCYYSRSNCEIYANFAAIETYYVGTSSPILKQKGLTYLRNPRINSKIEEKQHENKILKLK